LVRRLSAPAELLTVAEDIIHEGQRESANMRAICLKLTEVLLLKAASATTGASQRSDEAARQNFLRCRAAIDSRASELSSLEKIAAEVRLQPESVCRLFRRFQRVSPYRYLIRRKMTLAAEILLDSGALVKEAAAQVGFPDPYHFARCFKKVHGIAPSEMRRAHDQAQVKQGPSFSLIAPPEYRAQGGVHLRAGSTSLATNRLLPKRIRLGASERDLPELYPNLLRRRRVA
jgi:AraC-like DNA-binding protein